MSGTGSGAQLVLEPSVLSWLGHGAPKLEFYPGTLGADWNLERCLSWKWCATCLKNRARCPEPWVLFVPATAFALLVLCNSYTQQDVSATACSVVVLYVSPLQTCCSRRKLVPSSACFAHDSFALVVCLLPPLRRTHHKTS